MGPIGSGKSTACVMEILRRSAEQAPDNGGVRRSRWAVVRNTYPELKTTTIKTWHQWMPPEIGHWRDEGPPTHHVKTHDLDMEVMFVALDRPQDVRKLLSMELTGAWVNEAREIPKAVLDGLTGRVGRYPPVRDGGATWSGIIMDTNPPDSDHWWYRLAEEERPDGFAFFRQPSGLAPNAENIQFLPAGYYTRAALGKGEDWVKVYVRGEYGFVRDGKPVYPEFVDALHAVEIAPDKRFDLHVGIDFGLTPAAVFVQRTPTGCARVVGELVTQDMGAMRFGELLHAELAGRYNGFTIGSITGDPAGDIRAQTDETTPFDMLRACKVNAFPALTNDFNMRREAVAQPLSRLVDGKPGLVVSTGCRWLRKAMAGAYCYRRVQVSGQERYRDVPDKGEYSHVAEALQYAMLGTGEGNRMMGTPIYPPSIAPQDWGVY